MGCFAVPIEGGGREDLRIQEKNRAQPSKEPPCSAEGLVKEKITVDVGSREKEPGK